MSLAIPSTLLKGAGKGLSCGADKSYKAFHSLTWDTTCSLNPVSLVKL